MTDYTTPTIVTKSEYKNAMFAINSGNENGQAGDHWLILADGRHVYCGNDMKSLQNTISAAYSGELDAEVVAVDVTGESGEPQEIEAYVFSTSDAWNDLDLEELAEGRIEWK